MKKIITSVFTLLVAGSLCAENFTSNKEGATLSVSGDTVTQIFSKRGTPILPEAGDYAIGFEAGPFLRYVGNFLNQSGNQPPSANFAFNQSIVGKMFKDAQTAYRGRVRLGFGSTSDRNLVMDDANTTDPNAMVEDERTTSYSAITLGAGIEKRRGSTRIQGFYGGEALIGFRSSSTSRTFGNSFTATNMMPTTTDFTNNTSGPVSSRETEMSNGTTINLQIRGFVGVEIFVFPKVSLAMEFGWGPSFSTTGEGESTNESWDAANSTVQTQSMPIAGGGSFSLDNDNAGGAITALFHF